MLSISDMSNKFVAFATRRQKIKLWRVWRTWAWILAFIMLPPVCGIIGAVYLKDAVDAVRAHYPDTFETTVSRRDILVRREAKLNYREKNPAVIRLLGR